MGPAYGRRAPLGYGLVPLLSYCFCSSFVELVQCPAIPAHCACREANHVLISPREPYMQAFAVKDAEELPAFATPLMLHRICPPLLVVHKQNPLGERSGVEFSQGAIPGFPGKHNTGETPNLSPITVEISKQREKIRRSPRSETVCISITRDF